MSRTKSDYEEIAVLRDPDGLGLIAPITRLKKGNGYHSFSFAIMKEFERTPGGPTQRSSFLNVRHIPGVIKLIESAEKMIESEKDKLLANRRSA